MEKKENKKTNQRLESTKAYINDLSKNYSKLNFVRLDLSYKKEYENDLTLEEANKDFKTMLNNKRSKPTVFDGMVGYVAKKELGDDKGVHIHMLAIYDGQKVREDITKGTQIGVYWKENITKGNGLYQNCNQNKYKANKAVGIIEHKCKQKKKIKKKMINKEIVKYLSKTIKKIKDYSTYMKKLIDNKLYRELVTGKMTLT